MTNEIKEIVLTNETKSVIRKAVRERLTGKVSEYKIRKMIKASLENPRSWYHPDDDEDDDPQNAGIQRYYRNINSPTRAPNICLDFRDHCLRVIGVYYV